MTTKMREVVVEVKKAIREANIRPASSHEVPDEVIAPILDSIRQNSMALRFLAKT